MNASNAAFTDTTATDPALSDNPSVTQAGGEGAGAGTAQADTSSGDQTTGSSTNPDSSTSTESAMDRYAQKLGESRGLPQNQTTQPAATPHAELTLAQVQESLGIKSIDDLKRIQNQNSLYGRQANELGSMRKQYADLQQAQLADRQRQEAEAAKANLSPFHSKHPQYQVNQTRITRASTFLATLDALPPEQRADTRLVNSMAQRAGVSSQDIDMASQARDHRERVAAEQAADPEGFIESRVERVISQRFQQFEQYLNNRTSAQGFVQQNQHLINDPQSQQIMATALDPNTSRSDLAVQLATLTRERDELLSRASRDTAEVETLKAKDELASRQNITRRRASVSTTTQQDPWASFDPKDPKAQDKLLDRLFSQR